MDFRIADTFTDSLAHLTGDEQKAVKTTAFDLQMNPVNPGMSLHKLDTAKDKNFWSVRVSSDIRLIVHKTASSLLLCYVDHHDKAYHWAERRKLEVHPTTGAAQFVEIRERVEEIPVPKYVVVEQPVPTQSGWVKPTLFLRIADDELLGYGVPPEWLADVRAANEDTLLELTDHLPAEASEALLELATGGVPRASGRVRPSKVTDQMSFDPNVCYDLYIPDEAGLEESASSAAFAHPDAQRRFRTISDVDELERAFAYPWDKWTIFLHPAQREWVERDYSGPARVSGSAGTGKTIVALHRAVHLARANPDARVLLATFSDTLANALHDKLRRLINNQPSLGERLEVCAMDTLAARLYEAHFGQLQMADSEAVRSALTAAADMLADQRFGLPFLLSEWRDVVDAWQLATWEEYRDVRRLGRRTRLSETQRAQLWPVFEKARSQLQERGLVTRAGMYHRLTAALIQRKHPPFEFAVIDEAQDVSVAQLRFLAAFGAKAPNALFFAGDLGQRIFQQPFSWKSLGVDIRGRARTLHINYRTSHQIRMQADRLLAPEVADVDGNVEDRSGTVSVFNGTEPSITRWPSQNDEAMEVGRWLVQKISEGVQAQEIGVFVRSFSELDRARAAVAHTGLPHHLLDGNPQAAQGKISIATMHLAKGLEFRAVMVMACDDEVIPSQERLESVADDADLEEIYNTERHLLYVACTRARDHLWVSGVDPASEFLDDLEST
ncbi:DNA helicase [Rhodanobacter sp. Root480]|uniref:3'-5' exonuclease n=1 Tax=Rhodanobacter sp. Root480 TaxID=1736542 RepID=UPI0006F2C9B3|nr:3'-5' exonuclease [Rhodanobacter sp. Root480]KQX98172.1 DNA helicase [Rhodanobacter sp. Root480]